MAGKLNDLIYPEKYETEIHSTDGLKIILRPIRSDDIEQWLDFVSRLSKRTRYLRFHSLPKLTREDAVKYCMVDYKNSFAFVAEASLDLTQKIIAIGRYSRLPDTYSADLALVIEDPYQKKGIGSKLMEWLANVAHENGIFSFEADILSENREILSILKSYGFHITSELHGGVYHIKFPISPVKKDIQD